MPRLGGNEHFIAVPGKLLLQQVAETLLRTARGWTVIVRQVKVADTQLHGSADDGRILRPVIGGTEIVPQAQGYFRQQHPAAPASSVFHGGIIAYSPPR